MEFRRSVRQLVKDMGTSSSGEIGPLRDAF